MIKYISLGDFQNKLKSYYEKTGFRMQFLEFAKYLSDHDGFSDHIASPAYPKLVEQLSDRQFNNLVDSIPISWDDYANLPSTEVEENDMISKNRDVFTIRHLLFTRPQVHRHNYYEIDIVMNGQASFYFEEEKRILKKGELCIIAPYSSHEISIDKEGSIVYTISIRKSTFDSAFFSLLSGQDLLSLFFRMSLQDKKSANYLLFHIDDMSKVTMYVRNLFLEANLTDNYSNISCISYVYLMFAEILRNYSHSIQFYNYEKASDFSLLLQYIQHNYRTVTLSGLCEMFNYSEPHLCNLIKQNSGYTFSELIRSLRLNHAVAYLINTNMKIFEIAEAVGYNSADHFSRMFRAEYKLSPQQYRQKYKLSVSDKLEDEFHPYHIQ